MEEWELSPPMSDSGPRPKLSKEALDELIAYLEGALQEHPDACISFQTASAGERLSLNPAYSNIVTPQAIYAFPARHILDWTLYERHKAKSRLHHMGFIGRERAFLFVVDGPVIDTESYTSFQEDAEKLRQAWRDKVKVTRHSWGDENGVDSVIDGFLRNHTPTENPRLQIARLFHMTEHLVHLFVPVQEVCDGSFLAHPDKPAVWREVFASLGYSAFHDKNSILTGDYPQQIAVFDDSRIQHLAVFDNPISPDLPKPAAGPRF